ncbi:hypothetical protein F5884DRAFT_852937 [Xylogone sp. PMI_703]|nr:hypothetical protein F5884DRAFT_852937 [Xylogone sp. PMI_703]
MLFLMTHWATPHIDPCWDGSVRFLGTFKISIAKRTIVPNMILGLGDQFLAVFWVYRINLFVSYFHYLEKKSEYHAKRTNSWLQYGTIPEDGHMSLSKHHRRNHSTDTS